MGEYELVFVRVDAANGPALQKIKIKIKPKFGDINKFEGLLHREMHIR